jgi:hypothetical protein
MTQKDKSASPVSFSSGVRPKSDNPLNILHDGMGRGDFIVAFMSLEHSSPRDERLAKKLEDKRLSKCK